MSPLLVAFLGVLLVPLFVATWRTSLLGLGCQGFLMAFIAYRLEPNLGTAEDWLALVDLAIVRGLGAPLALYTVLRARKAPSRNDVIPPNLLFWTVALGMVLVSFSFAEVLVPQPGEQRTLVAVASSGILLGFLVLATQAGPFSQMIGALRIENALALFELGGTRRESSLGVQFGLLAVFIVTIALFRWFLAALGSTTSRDDKSTGGSEEPTL